MDNSPNIKSSAWYRVAHNCKRLEIQDFDAFLETSETGSFRKAAIGLGVSQSVISRRIQKLEEALGVSLFERSATGARLTVAGWNFASRGRYLLRDLQCAIRYAQCAGLGKHGQLTLGLIASLSHGLLRNVVADFVSRHPQIKLTFTECDRSELLAMLSHRQVDVVFASGTQPTEFGDMLRLTDEPIFLVVPERHPFADRTQVKWVDVSGQLFLTSTMEPGPEIREYIVGRVGDLGRHPRIDQHRLDREGIMNLVGLGLGVSVVADHWRGVEYPNIHFVPFFKGERPECIPFSLTWRPENDNPALRRFLSLARVHAKAHAAPS